MAQIYRRKTCRLCEGTDLELVFHLEPTPPADHYISREQLDKPQEVYPLDLFFCKTCTNLQLLDVIDPEVLFGNYIYTTSSSPGLINHFQKYSEEIIRQLQPSLNSLCIDIGSNDGTLLRFLKEKGFRVLGVDPAREVAQRATKSGIETLPHFFSSELGKKMKKDFGTARIITANNVFAHSDTLGDMAKGIRGLLSPDGIFIFEISYVVDLVQNMVFDFIYHEHLCYHSLESLKIFFNLHDLELIDAQRVSTKGGSLRCFVQVKNGPLKPSKTLKNLLKIEKEEGYNSSEKYKVYAKKINGLRGNLEKLLKKLKTEKKKIGGYGASATVTTLIYHFHLGDSLAFIVDDEISRQNLYSPGFHIPILSPDKLYSEKPDYVLILAWRFADQIISKHQKFRDEGGQFIVPLPELTVI